MQLAQSEPAGAVRLLIVREAETALRLARAGCGRVVAFLPDWDAVDRVRARALLEGIADRLTVHHLIAWIVRSAPVLNALDLATANSDEGDLP